MLGYSFIVVLKRLILAHAHGDVELRLYAPVNGMLRNEYHIIQRYGHLHVLENLVVAAITLLQS